MLKMAYSHAYWALFCIKVALVTDQETFDRVQAQRKLRKDLYEVGDSSVRGQHPLAQKITCGLCGKHFIRRFGNTKAKYKLPLWACQTYLKRTKAVCPSRRISEKVLFPILAGIFGVSEEEVLDVCHRVDEIIVYPDGRLIVTVDGETYERQWENPSRALSWTDEMRAEAARKETMRKQSLRSPQEKSEEKG